MLVVRVLLALTGLGLASLLIAFLVLRDRRLLRYALILCAVSAVLALAFFGGLFLARL
jgi:hypothetical protein